MADGSKIEWTEATWNPITGCSLASPGCTNCYAMKLAGTRMQNHESRKGLTIDTKAGPVWNGEVRFNEQWLDQPLRWKRPRMIFVCAHGDLFHESVPDEWIDRVFAVMALAPQHTFQVLTKRSARMRDYLSKVWGDLDEQIARTTAAVNHVFRIAGHRGNWGRCGSTSTSITTISRGTGAREYAMLRRLPDGGVERFYWHNGEESWHRCGEAYAAKLPDWAGHRQEFGWGLKQWPLPNVWLGVSVEDQKRADERIPDLLATPATVRWISAEPLLGPLKIRSYLMAGRHPGGCGNCGRVHGFIRCPNYGGISKTWSPYEGAAPTCTDFRRTDFAIDWVVAGGESGREARPMHPAWARALRDQCNDAAVPFFFKQWGAWAPLEKALPAQPGSPGMTAWPDGTVRFGHDVDPSVGAGISMFLGTKSITGRMLDGRTWDEVPA